VQGWDLSGFAEGRQPTRVFRFWAGDDVDASVVVDEEGMLYVGAEYERATARSREVGQVFKLDPSRPDDPLVWSVHDRDTIPSGIWARPACTRTSSSSAPTAGGCSASTVPPARSGGSCT